MEFTHAELVMILNMCMMKTAAGFGKPSEEPWLSIYAKTEKMIRNLLASGHVCVSGIPNGCPPHR